MPEPTRTPITGQPRPVPMVVREFTARDLIALRHTVVRLAEDNGLTDPALYRFVLAVHEIAVNAVRHGGGQGQLELWRTSTHLHCRITDQGPGMPPQTGPTRPTTDATSGRGLWLAHRACQITTTSGHTGTTVTLTCPIPSRKGDRTPAH
jgi:anti-sigma regulatory factor (Ser/Thr protein kinase)